MRSKSVDIDIPSYPTAAALIRDEAGRMFLNLEEKSLLEVGYLFGLDRYLKTEGSIRSAVSRARNLVLQEPEKYGVSMEKVAYIQGLLNGRAIVQKPETLREERSLETMDISTMVVDSRNLATKLVKKKLDHLDQSPKALAEMSLKELIGAFHILFDKGQIIQGQATENIAVLSKININLNPDEALAAIMRMREEMQAK